MSQNRKKILVVEDHPQTVYAIRQALRMQTYEVDVASSCAAAEQKIAQHQYDVVVLDRNLPDGDGLQLLTLWQDVDASPRVLVLSERGTVSEKVDGLRSGADDYLPKPFSADELLLRLQALLRRSRTHTKQSLRYGELAYFPEERLLQVKDEHKQLSYLCGGMLELLLRHPGHVVSREKLASSLWTVEDYPQAASIDVLASRLRKALRPCGVRLVSKQQVGYALQLV